MHLSTSFLLFAMTMYISCSSGNALTADEYPRRVTTQWSPYVEWRVANSSVEGNPYDVVAEATFVHVDSSERISTPLYYDGSIALSASRPLSITTETPRGSSVSLELEQARGPSSLRARTRNWTVTLEKSW